MDVCVLSKTIMGVEVLSTSKESIGHASSTELVNKMMSIESLQDQERTQTEDFYEFFRSTCIEV